MAISSKSKSQHQQKIFLEGSEVRLNGDEQCVKILKTQTISKELAETSVSALELVFENGKLKKKFEWSYGDRDEDVLEEDELGMPSINVTPHTFYLIQITDSSASYLGGEVPTGFKVPKYESRPSFQYIGKLSKETDGLNWLPVDLHLVVPLYGSFDQLFIDYSDPLNLVVINEGTYLETEYEDDYVKHDTELVYEKVFIETEISEEIPDGYGYTGHLGVPKWIQYPAIPTCPKSGNTMKFIAQFKFDLGVNLGRTNIEIPQDEYYSKLLQKMNFASDGDLYVFMDPESMVVCYIIQHT